MSQNGAHYKKKSKARRRKTVGRVLLIILVLLLAMAAVGYAVFHHLYSQLNTKAAARVTPTPQTQNAEPASTPAGPTPTPEEPAETNFIFLPKIIRKLSSNALLTA